MKALAMIGALVLWFVPSVGNAEGDIHFQTTEDEIVEELTRPPSRSYDPTSEVQNLPVLEKQRTWVIRKSVNVSTDSKEPRVNLKVEFDYDSYAVREASFSLLDALGRALTREELSGKPILIMGHTDSDGPDDYNLRLSFNRALSIEQYLKNNFHIEPERIRITGYGEGIPLVPNTTAANKQINRRVEVQVDLLRLSACSR